MSGHAANRKAAVAVEYALDIVSLSKRFQRRAIGKAGYGTLKSALLGLFSRSKGGDSSVLVTEAVKDITVRIPCGNSVGIIGRNGSGKSTLLKLITGIYRPDAGYVKVNGRVAALIELGAGFHPDFSGRENIMLGGIMYGLTKAEVLAKFDAIVAFAELEAVIDEPVRTYSSGMFMRLGFSLAIHVDPDVLLIDEVLAVGDAGFTAKCKERITRLRTEGKTLLMVSHDLDAVERWCDEVIWINKGEILDRGEPRRVIDAYRQFIEHGEELALQLENEELVQAESHSNNQEPASEAASSDDRARWGGREIEITSVRMKKGGEQHYSFHSEDAVLIEFDYHKNESVNDVVFGVGLSRSDGLQVLGTNTDIGRVSFDAIGDSGTVQFLIDRLGLLEGGYSLDVASHKSDGYPYDYHRGCYQFQVKSQQSHVGVFAPQHSWQVIQKGEA
jgi:lipopolysaccharide transport system ATP-binding protein